MHSRQKTWSLQHVVGWDSAVDTATRYRLPYHCKDGTNSHLSRMR